MDPKSNATQKSPPAASPAKKGSDMGGEGNYEATRQYNAGVANSVKKGDADALAEEAKKALEGPEGDELRKAEQQGKQGAVAAPAGHKPAPK